MPGVGLDDTIQLAKQLAVSGRAGDAESILRQLTRRHPSTAAVWQALGDLLKSAGRPLQAIAALEKAASIDPAAELLLADLLVRQERYSDAVALLRQHIRRTPTAIDAGHQLARIAVAAGRPADAIESLHLLASQSKTAEPYFLLGVCLLQASRPREAIRPLIQAARLDPALPEPLANLGLALRSIGKLNRAIAAYRQAIPMLAQPAAVRCNLGVALAAAGQIEKAMATYWQAIAEQPSLTDAHFNLGNAFLSQGRWREAGRAYERAIELRPDFAEAHSNLGTTHRCLGEFAAAHQAYAAAIEHEPAAATPRWNRSLLHLLQGNWPLGWKDFHHRNKVEPPSTRPFAGPAWVGQPMPGGTILLHHEMGLGDTMQFSRYAPLVAARSQARVIIEVQPSLKRLMQSLADVDSVIDSIIATGDPLPAYDGHASLMELPRIFGTTTSNVPQTCPYLAANPAAASNWENRLSAIIPPGHRRIGLVWAGRAEHQYDADRSIALDRFTPLGTLANISLVSLQLGPAAQQLTAQTQLSLLDFTSDLHDWSDTAALIDQLDDVIAVDTAVAHLAGAMGKPVWLLLPFVPDWRWLLEREDTPWYPTMRLFRQPALGDWRTPIAKLMTTLSGSAKR